MSLTEYLASCPVSNRMSTLQNRIRNGISVGDGTASLAQSITWAGSKQTYYTARLMVDRALVNDCFRAYAYFRWADDVIDVTSTTDEERIAFIQRQRALIARCYRNRRTRQLLAEEEMVAELIDHDTQEESGLQSFIRNFLAVIEFDAYRKGRLISQRELTWYSECLGKSVTDGIQYFIHNGHPYPEADNRYLAAIAAHVTHMLRDMVSDIDEGFVNIPREDLARYGIDLQDVNGPAFRAWVRDRVTLARDCFRRGKQYLDGLSVLRCKIVGYWYCVRFESVLDTIERDGYTLRAAYHERRRPSTWLRMIWAAVAITVRHVTRRQFWIRDEAVFV